MSLQHMDRTPEEMQEDASMWSRAGYPAVAVGRYRAAADQIKRLTDALREAIAQMESDAVFHLYDRGHRSIGEIPDRELPDALLHARATLAPQTPT